MNKPSPQATSNYQLVEKHKDGIYQGFYYGGQTLKGIVMVNDEPRAKQYEHAVQEGWSRQRVEESFMV
jgi:hypothetical protein